MGKRSRTKSLNTAELQDISPEPGPSRLQIDANEPHFDEDEDQECSEGGESGTETESLDERHSQEEDVQRNDDDASEPPWDVLDPEGFAGPSEKVVKPLTSEALAAFNAAQERTGVVYISRIPPGMRPTKVRHLMSQYGEVGRVYLQQEDPKRAYLRKKFTSTKKVHFTEGWVEFKDKRVARSVADILNAQPIGGKKGTRWHDDVWTMKYLPRFKWSMLTDQIAHEAAIHTARLRTEIEQSRKEQKEYLQQVELARVLNKRVKRKREAAEARGEAVRDEDLLPALKKSRDNHDDMPIQRRKKRKDRDMAIVEDTDQLEKVLGSVF